MRSTRRGFLLGLGALIAAPAVVKVSSLMPVRVPINQRMVWEVYPTLYQPDSDYPVADGVWARPNGFGGFDRQTRRAFDALRGVDLARYEAMNIPRVELLRIGDRVVDKRIVGGVAQILPKTVRATWDDDARKLPATAQEAVARDLANTVPVFGPGGTWNSVMSRSEIEARHQRSDRSRRQAAEVFERAQRDLGVKERHV